MNEERMRVAFCGASGTGKTTLAKFVASVFKLPMNPVGARSVLASMGLDTSYGMSLEGRAEFQRRLIAEKREWERREESFVTDRTTFDNLTYMALHAIDMIDDDEWFGAHEGFRRYTHVFYCPVSAFCCLDEDPMRKNSMSYQRAFDATLHGLLIGKRNVTCLWNGDQKERQARVLELLGAV